MSFIYVATSHGAILEVDYHESAIKRVFQLSEHPLTAIIAQRDAVIVASADNYIRVWASDFSECKLEAQFDGNLSPCDF